MTETDVCIIGAGIMGSAAAYYLSKTTSQRILLIDRYNLANDYCSSNDTNRVFRYAYGKDEFYTQLAIESRKLWLSLERVVGSRLLVPSELMLVQGVDEEWNSFNMQSHRTMERLGLKTEQLDRDEIRKRYPQFNAEKAFTDPYAGTLLAKKALTTFHAEARKNGVRILENTHIRNISSPHEPTVQIQDDNGNNVRSKKLLVTIGPWSGDLKPSKLTKMTPTRQQVLYFQPKNPSHYRPPNFPVFFMDQFYGIPAVGTDAVKISHMGRDTPTDPETVKRSVDQEEVEACRNVLQRFIPELARGPVAGSKVCLYDMTPDKDFVLGPDPDNPSIIYGYGFSGHGFKFAPLIGRTLANLVLESPPGIDISRFQPIRLQ